MRKFLVMCFLVLLACVSLNASDKKMRYQAVKSKDATLLQTSKSKKFCNVCGMTLPMFYKTNHAAKHNGENKQYCSAHCLLEDKEVNKVKLTDIKVVDNSSLKFIKAKKAFYVVGSNKPATMSKVSKYAFLNKKDAKKFAASNGGEVKSYKEVYSEVSKGMTKEKNMIAKKQAKMEKMGKKVYSKMCKKTNNKFSNTADAKSYVNENKLCGKLKGKKLQAVGIYLSRR